MIPATREISVTSTLEPKKKVKLAVDHKNSRQLMTMLSAIYSDEEAAIIREYITNALDSHIEAGQTKPIEITSPGRLSPFFVIQDFGVGLSMDDLCNVYALYGASTKRETQDQAGSLGIGAKSALAYAGQFTVSSIKDGEKVVAIISLDEDEAGVMDILSVTETDEHNGVTITIPVNNNHNQFNGKLHKMHSFLEPGLMLVDGVDATREHITEINEVFSFYGDQYSGDIIMMGNVAYPLDRNVYGRIHRSFSVIVRVQMGEVLFTPSREELNYTPRTRQTLDKYKASFNDNLLDYMQKVINDQPTKRDAYNKQYEFHRRLDYYQRQNAKFTYKGADLPNAIADRIGGECVSWGLGGRTYCRNHGYTDFESIPENVIYLTNFNNAKFTKVQALKLNKFLADNDIKHDKTMYIISSNKDFKGLLDGITIYDYEAQIKPVKVMNSVGTGGNGRGRGKARKYLVTGGGEGHGLAVPNTKVALWYGSKSELGSSTYVDWHNKTQQFDNADNQFVFVTEKEVPAFKKNYPQAKHYRYFFVDKLKEAFDALTTEHYHAVQYSAGIRNSQLLNAEDLIDPVLKAFVMADKDDGDLYALRTEVEEIYPLLRKVPMNVQQEYRNKMPQRNDTRPNEILENYPVLHSISSYGYINDDVRKHFTEYANARYTEMTKEKEGADASI